MKRRLRSAAVILTLAAPVAACDSEPTQPEQESQAVCVDQNDVVVPDRECYDDQNHYSHFVYYPYGVGLPAHGQKATGSVSKPAQVSRPGSVNRGGFGGGGRGGSGGS